MAQPTQRSPWWQVTRTPRPAFILGSVWLLILLLELAVGLSRHQWPWYLVVLIFAATVSSVMYLTSAVLQVRRSRVDGSESRPSVAG